jgi:hypothetical protein
LIRAFHCGGDLCQSVESQTQHDQQVVEAPTEKKHLARAYRGARHSVTLRA